MLGKSLRWLMFVLGASYTASILKLRKPLRLLILTRMMMTYWGTKTRRSMLMAIV